MSTFLPLFPYRNALPLSQHANLLSLHTCTHSTSSVRLFNEPHTCSTPAEFQQPVEVQPLPDPTPKPYEISTSVIDPPQYKTGAYSSLSHELQVHAHSRITVDLRPGFDFMEIMLELLQWAEQDVEQMWIRPADHVDQPSYDIKVPYGLETAILDLLRKVGCNSAVDSRSID